MADVTLRGVMKVFPGGATAVATGYLGGHLSFVRGVGQGERGLEDRGDAIGAVGAMLDLDESARLIGR